MEATNNNAENGELFKFFKEKSNGVGYDFEGLWQECKGYADRFELSRELNRLAKLRLIEKRGKHYFYLDVDAEIKKILGVVEEKPVEPEPKPAPRVRTVAPKVKPTKPEVPKPEIAPMGKLRRGAAVTPIALAFYYNQSVEMTTGDLHARTGVSKQVASQTVRRLVDEGYIEPTKPTGGGARFARYRWTNKFRYPFPESTPEDWNWKSTRVEKALPPSEPVADPETSKEQPSLATVVSMGKDQHLQALDDLISRHERELEALRLARNLYVCGTQVAT